MTSHRSEVSNSSNQSTNRLLYDNENLNIKYNQYKKNLSQITSNNSVNNSQSLNKFFSRHNYNLLIPSNLPENDKDSKYTILKELYDQRLISLYSQINSITHSLITDDILSTMKCDLNTREYFNQRIGEIIADSLGREKEGIINQLAEENAELQTRFDYVNHINKSYVNIPESEEKINKLEKLLSDSHQKNIMLQSNLYNFHNSTLKGPEVEFPHTNQETDQKHKNDIQKLKNENFSLSQQLNFYEEKLKEISEENEEYKLEFDRLQKVISVLEIDLNSVESKIKDKQTRIESLQLEQTNLQTELFELNLKFKKSLNEVKTIQSQNDVYEKEKKEILEKYSTFTDELDKSRNEKQEKQNREKLEGMKKKKEEMKNVIENLEKEISQEKSNSVNLKSYYTKILSEMEEGMKLIKSKWEKRLKEENCQFERIISEIENKNNLEIKNLKHEHSIDIENKIREINRLKQSEDLLKNFENEFVRIKNHEEILNDTMSQFRKKFEKELIFKEEEMECELRKRILKLEDEKNGEYEFLTENLRKNLKSLERSNEELKQNFISLQNKYHQEKNSNENFSETVLDLQKKLKSLNSQLEDKNILCENLFEKIQQNDENINSLQMIRNNLMIDLENISNENSLIENEKNNLLKRVRETEENLKEEFSKAERTLKLQIERQEEKLNNKEDFILELKNKNNESKNLLKESQNENFEISTKLKEMNNILEESENNFKKMNSKLKFAEENFNETEKKYNDCYTVLKNLRIAHSNKMNFITSTMKSKVSLIRSEINSIKESYKSDLIKLKKENFKIFEILINKIKLFLQNFDQQSEMKLKNNSIQIENEYKTKICEKDLENQNEIKKVEIKFEKLLLEQFNLNEKLEKENKTLLEDQQTNFIKCREHLFRNTENESEIKSLQNLIHKLKLEKEILTNTLDKIGTEKISSNNSKVECEEENYFPKFKLILSKVLNSLSKMKKKYSGKISDLKCEVEKLKDMNKGNECKIYFLILTKKLAERNNLFEELNFAIQSLENELKIEKEKSEKKNLKEEEKEKDNIHSIQKDLENLKEIYESKINILRNKIKKREDSLKEKRDLLNKRDDVSLFYIFIANESK